ncbi:MAG: hypothetical protein SH868_16490 [Bythopirellula sp.]|nr:hypothetical protein [Bythopirellula sp.]
MFRTLQVAALVVCTLCPLTAVQATSTHFWLSTQGFPSASPLPTTSATVAEFDKFKGEAGGSIYIWGRPEVGETLENWSLNLLVSDNSVLTFTNSDVYEAGETSVNRWQNVGEPTGTTSQIKNIAGFSPTNLGLGIGSATQGSDLYYDSVRNGWLLAKVNYTLQTFSTFKSANLFLQIGSLGITNTTGTSANVDVIFGHQTDNSRNGLTQRQSSSAFPDGVIKYFDKPDADFDGNTIVNGRDFLIWQRNFGTTTLLNANGNANPGGGAGQDSSVNHIDLAAWQFQYGMTVIPTLVESLEAVPEPSGLALAIWGVSGVFSTRLLRSSRGRLLPRFPLRRRAKNIQPSGACVVIGGVL